jgi:hypothetical protein
MKPNGDAGSQAFLDALNAGLHQYGLDQEFVVTRERLRDMECYVLRRRDTGAMEFMSQQFEAIAAHVDMLTISRRFGLL